MNDIELGWSPFFEAGFQPFAQQGYCAARVAQEHRNGYLVLSSAHGELRAELAGAFRHRATERRDLPAVGDWVAIDYVLPETAALSGLSQYELLTGLGDRFDRIWGG